jgi:hypothetical protein
MSRLPTDKSFSINGFTFSIAGELLGTPVEYTWYHLQHAYTYLINAGEYISASRIQHLANAHYPEINEPLFVTRNNKHER